MIANDIQLGDIRTQTNVPRAGSAGMAGNIVLGGLIGAAVDAGTGAMKDLQPNPVSVKLIGVSDKSSDSRDQC